MDPLSVSASIAGLLTAAGEVGKILGPYVSAARDIPSIAYQVHSEVQSTKIVLSAVAGLTANLAAASVRNASLIEVDHVVTVFTNGTLIFSELEEACGTLADQHPSALKLRSRLQFARKESLFTTLLTRLRGFKTSLSLMLTILSCDSGLQATRFHTELSSNIGALLESNQALTRRLLTLEDHFDAQSIATQRQGLLSTHLFSLRVSDGQQQWEDDWDTASLDANLGIDAIPNLLAETSRMSIASAPGYQPVLDTSRVYRRVKRNSMDFSCRASIAGSVGWSVFSGLSLADISVVSVIALPLYPEDLSNPQHYRFDTQSETPQSIPHEVQHGSDKGRIFQECLSVKAGLFQIPGFRELFDKVPQVEHGLLRPMDEVRAVLIQGYPLLMLLNEFGHQWDIQKYRKHFPERLSKQSVCELVQYCVETLRFGPMDIFTVNDLMGDDYLGFSKVVGSVKLLLGHLERPNVNDAMQLPSIPAVRGEFDESNFEARNIIDLFVDEERGYLRELRELYETRNFIQCTNGLNADKVSAMFAPMSSLLDHQIRFLLDVEATACQSIKNQDWKTPFIAWGDCCRSYAVLITHEKMNRQMLATHLASRPHLDPTQVAPIKTVLRLLGRPYIRLTQYLKFLSNLTAIASPTELEAQFIPPELSHPTAHQLSTVQMQDLSIAKNTVNVVLENTDEEIKRLELDTTVEDLKRRVVDWRTLNIETFGRLLMFQELRASHCPRLSELRTVSATDFTLPREAKSSQGHVLIGPV